MNRHKALVLALKGLLLSISLFLLYLLSSPVAAYLKYEPAPLYSTILSSKNYASESYTWLQKHYKWEIPKSGTTPQLIWLDDPAALTSDFDAQLKDNVLIGEFLSGSERATEPQRQQIEAYFDLSYTGYIGKACKDLGDPFEVSEAIRKRYTTLYRQKWDFRGEGIIFVSNYAISIFKQGEDYNGQLTWQTDDMALPFSDYFEVVQTTQPVSSYYTTAFTQKGQDRLSALGLPSTFPASIETDHPLYDGLYLTSAFKKNQVNVPHFYQGIERFMANKRLYERGTTEEIYWKWYIQKIKSATADLSKPKPTVAASEAPLAPPLFKVSGKQILKRVTSGNYEPFYIKGVNLGAAVPGKTFTEFPKEVRIYKQWLTQMGQLHINTLRVYTLLPPEFYKALYDYNQTTAEPIYLLQEIWPEEKPLNHDYLAPAYNETYQQEIAYAVHAVHGNANVPKRSYRAYGAYAYDVSPYLIGYLVGRELEPEEVLATDELNIGYSFKGQYLYGDANASPTENWLAASCDFALTEETQHYRRQSLVAIVNWPTLDPIDHFSEWNEKGDKSLQYNDKTVVDINHIGIHADQMPGFFGAYHIYPNYPDFMNNDPIFEQYADEQGRFRYGGYLKAFMAQHQKYPALVAEYGISTSMTTAHIAPDGNHHGGLSEAAQGPEIIRMAKAIEREGYAGGLIFEWLDEWAKKTWITEPYMIPYNRHALWHNVMDPEQNYGLIAMFPSQTVPRTEFNGKGYPLSTVQVETDARFVTLNLKFDSLDPKQQVAEILLNTHTPVSNTSAWEFRLQLNDAPRLTANPGYNWTKNRFEAKKVSPDQFEDLILQTNGEGLLKDGTKIPSIQINLSTLKLGDFNDLHAQVMQSGNWVRIRLPYTLLGISDPSSRQVLSDPATYNSVTTDQIKTLTTPQLHFQINTAGQPPIELKHTLRPWDEIQYTSRPKASFDLLSDYFKSLD